MSDLEKLLKETVGELDRLLKAKNVLGEPIDREGTTIIPLVSYGFGFSAGGGAGKSGSEAAGAGAGGGVRPVGAIIIDKSGARIEAVQGVTMSLAHVIADAATSVVNRRRKGGTDAED